MVKISLEKSPVGVSHPFLNRLDNEAFRSVPNFGGIGSHLYQKKLIQNIKNSKI